jgi:archaellum component FlaC
MGIFSESFEEEIFDLKERIKLLEKALREVKEVLNVKFSSNNQDWSYELQDIDKIVSEIPNL